MKLHRIKYLAGIITENVEDKQSEANEKIDNALSNLSGAKLKKYKSKQNKYNKLFSKGYESGDDDEMHDGLEGLEMIAQMLDPAKEETPLERANRLSGRPS